MCAVNLEIRGVATQQEMHHVLYAPVITLETMTHTHAVKTN